jgi:hypothetical protein
MREHSPQARDRFRRKPGREHWDVALEEAPDKIASPCETGGIVPRQEAERESAAHPELASGIARSSELTDVDRRELNVRDATGKRLGALSHQVERGRTQQEEVSGLLSGGAAIIDDASEDFEQTRYTMDLIDNNQFAGLRAQKRIRVIQAATIGGPLEVKVHRLGAPCRRDAPGQGRFADLTRAEQDHARRAPKAVLDKRYATARDH